MSIISDHLDRSIVQSNALQCFRSVVHRKFLCSEIYDLVERVQEMMINSSLKPIRNLCQAIFIQFLLDYPLENERLESHINFLLKNLSYCSESGRLQLL